jgi:hypothetical protein
MHGADISGRTVNTPVTGEFNRGFHQFQIFNLSTGVYFRRMVSGNFTATGKLLIFE